MVAYVAEIRMFAGEKPPANWAICDGTLLSVQQYPALAKLVMGTYGGDGIHTFGLPDLRGRIPIGQGQGVGLPNHVLGQAGGVETVALKISEIPAHTHSVFATPTYSTTATAGPTVGYASSPPQTTSYVETRDAPSVDAQLAGDAAEKAGLGRAHENVMPSVCLNYIICLVGSEPVRS